jgi:hypothetical protein
MAQPFSHSLRSLREDSFKGSRWILGLGLLVLAIWLCWFFMAQVSLYADSAPNAAHTLSSASGTADFPLEVGRRIKPGQGAVFHQAPAQPAPAAGIGAGAGAGDSSAGYNNNGDSFQATVSAVKFTAQGVEVSFVFSQPGPASASAEAAGAGVGDVSNNQSRLRAGLVGSLQVEVGHHSPASLVFGATEVPHG